MLNIFSQSFKINFSKRDSSCLYTCESSCLTACDSSCADCGAACQYVCTEEDTQGVGGGGNSCNECTSACSSECSSFVQRLFK